MEIREELREVERDGRNGGGGWIEEETDGGVGTGKKGRRKEGVVYEGDRDREIERYGLEIEELGIHRDMR